MDSVEQLLEIAKDNFKEHLSYLPLDAEGNEYHPALQILGGDPTPIYHGDIDAISLGNGSGYVYIKGKWADRVWSYFNETHFERLPIRTMSFAASLFMAAMLHSIRNKKE